MGDKNAYTASAEPNKDVPVIDSSEKHHALVVQPIISEGDSIGSVVFFSDEMKKTTEVEDKLARAAAGFLGRHMES